MSHKINLVRVLTAATGNSTPIVLGAAYSQLFMLPSEAGAMDGRTYSYLIVDGNNWELGRGVYTASGTTLSRNVIASRVSGTLGTSRISLSGTAQVRFVDAAEDMDGVRGTRPVTGTTDTLNNSDLGYVVTYSNAAAVAVSLAQAGASGLFLDGWTVFVKNKGVGAVTITPATSTIDGAATLVLAQNQGAIIWSDGTNYQSFKFRGDLGDSATKNVGTSAGTVAAGDDSRIIGSVKSVKIQKYTSSGTYTPDAKLVYAIIECVGGGGGGGGMNTASTYATAGAGGGAGSYSRAVASAATIGSSQTVTIGAGGSAGTSAPTNGGNGSDTSVGSLCIGKGGGGGGLSNYFGGLAGSGGVGGVTGTGDVATVGGRGQGGFNFTIPAGLAGSAGASSVFGGGGGGVQGGAGSAGTKGGGGAGGGASNNNVAYAGGAGGDGYVVITEYCSQ